MRVLKRLFYYFKENLFGEAIAIEHTVYTIVALAGIAIAIIGIIANCVIGLNAITVLLLAINIVIDVLCVLYSMVTKRWRVTSVIIAVYAIFVLFPFLWLFSGGATGSTLPLVVFCAMGIVVMFPGKYRGVLLIITLMLFLMLIWIELYWPDIVVPYPNRQVWYIDLMVGLVFSYCATAALAYFVILRYQKAKLEADRLVRRLEEMSLTDALTGAFNRRYLTACIDEEMRKAYDSGRLLTVCLIDIDFFKRINDSFGHLYGDEVLIKLSGIIAGQLDGTEVFGRYGGEEFIILFKNCGLRQALSRIENVMNAIRNTQWDHGETITVSCGVGSYVKGISYSKFIERADVNLYRAKANGRNCVIYL